MTLRPLAIAALMIACHGGGGGSGSDKLPAAIAKLAKGGEAQPFDGWSVPGVKLYRIVVAVPDHTSTTIVGIDDHTGAVVSSADLIKRMGSLPADELARRMFGSLISDNGRPLQPTETDHTFATDQEWKAVATPAIVDGALVFYSFRGEMSPELVQYRIALDSLAITITSAVDVLVARGETVYSGPALCEPVQRCHCWSGCARFQLVRVKDQPASTWELLGSTPPERFVREDCKTEPCARVCRADAPTADCDPALVETELKCDESCPPSEAPYHCDTLVDGCKQVDHPTRAKAAKPP